MLSKLSGDYSAVLEEIYENTLKSFQHTWDWNSRPSLVKDLENHLAKEAGMKSFYGFSYLCSQAATPHWHVDGAKNTIVMAYKHPTQFFMMFDKPFEFVMPNDGSPFHILDYAAKTAKEKSSDPNVSVFTPSVGIPYIFTNKVLHRSNPKGLGMPHLVIRVCEQDA